MFVDVLTNESARGEGVPPLRRGAILALPCQGEMRVDLKSKGKMPSPRDPTDKQVCPCHPILATIWFQARQRHRRFSLDSTMPESYHRF